MSLLAQLCPEGDDPMHRPRYSLLRFLSCRPYLSPFYVCSISIVFLHHIGSLASRSTPSICLTSSPRSNDNLIFYLFCRRSSWKFEMEVTDFRTSTNEMCCASCDTGNQFPSSSPFPAPTGRFPVAMKYKPRLTPTGNVLLAVLPRDFGDRAPAHFRKRVSHARAPRTSFLRSLYL